MFSAETETLLKQKLPTLPQMICAPSLRHDMDELVTATLPVEHVALVDDPDTATALGDSVYRALKSRYKLTRIDCAKHPKADMKLVEALRKKSAKADAIIGIGSGTISDLCKYASFLEKKPYIIFPTAASMNGYLSATASLSEGGYKQSYAAHLPTAVFCDLAIIAAAPARLSKCGLGDSLARPTAQADWLLSHLLINTPYDETPFALAASYEAAMLENARGIALRDAQSIKILMQLLLLSGLGMTIAAGSHPASQAEHMLAHSYEMLGRETTPTLHGEQIGITTLLCAHMQLALLEKPPHIKREPYPLDAITQHFGKRVAQEGAKAYLAKQERVTQAGLTNRSLKEKWPDVCHRLSQVVISPSKIHDILTQAQAPHRLEMLGWKEHDFGLALTYAHFLRDRFTCLDLG